MPLPPIPPGAPGVQLKKTGQIVNGIAGPDGVLRGAASIALRMPDALTVAGVKPFTNIYSASTANFTYAMQHAADGPFFGFRVAIENYNPTPMWVQGAKAGVVATNLESGVGDAFTMLAVDGQLSFWVPGAQNTGAPGKDVVPGRVISDPVFMPSVARSDGGTYPLLQTRVFIPGTPGFIAITSGATGSFYQYQQVTGKEFAVGYYGGDAVSTTPPITMSRDNNVVSCWPLFYMQNSHTVCAVGDSLTMGLQSSGGCLGAVQRACDGLTKTSGTQVYTCENHGIPGALHTDIYNNLVSILSQNSPSVMTFNAWSPNDALSQAIIDADWSRTLEMLRLCRTNGIPVILRTSGPSNSQVANNALRLAQNARVRAACVAGLAVLSDDGRTIDPSDSGTILPAYDSGDGVHYNDAGYTAISNNNLKPAILLALA